MSSNVHPNHATSFLALCAPAIWSGKGQCNSVPAPNEYISSSPSSPPLQNSTSFTTDTTEVVLLTSSRLALKFSCLPIYCGPPAPTPHTSQFSFFSFSNASLPLTFANYFARLLFLIAKLFLHTCLGKTYIILQEELLTGNIRCNKLDKATSNANAPFNKNMGLNTS